MKISLVLFRKSAIMCEAGAGFFYFLILHFPCSFSQHTVSNYKYPLKKDLFLNPL